MITKLITKSKKLIGTLSLSLVGGITYMINTKINRFLEIFRWVGVALGIFFAFYLGKTPIEQFNIFSLFSVVFISGITGFEIFFLAETSSKVSGYGEGGAYKRQSGLHFIALTVTMILVLLLNWGFFAYVGVFMVLLVFLTLSTINHLYTGLKEKFVINTVLRPVLTVFMWIISLYMLLPALGTIK